jgi:starch synthase
MKLLMVAAESGEIPGGKVGGIGDVIRDLPPSLVEAEAKVDVIMPGYQAFSALPEVELVGHLEVPFGGEQKTLTLAKLDTGKGYTIWIIDSPLFAPQGAGKVYCHDPDTQPFATDATKFALFCAGVAELLLHEHFGRLDYVHLHDWHAAFVAMLLRHHPRYQLLRTQKLVYTIHNLALQGIRPADHNESSLKAWYPDFGPIDHRLMDMRYPDCINPVRAAINLCDGVHTVSPSYVLEIQEPSNEKLGFYGGEGLDRDLRAAAAEDRLVGILNGCDYRDIPTKIPSWKRMLAVAEQAASAWYRADEADAHRLALQRIAQWKKEPAPTCVLTSVGRATDQKLRILREGLSPQASSLAQILVQLPPDAKLIMTGSGDPSYEAFLLQVAINHDNFLFLKGYSDPLGTVLYTGGDLFLMPSSFEPCGISQLLAMRAGQPVVAHAVGGLRDTIVDNETGFLFNGANLRSQSLELVGTVAYAMELFYMNPVRYRLIREAASKVRFEWSRMAQQYLRQLYL